MESENANLFQQIGQIQGTLTAVNSNITDFKNEFRNATSDQNKKIEDLRKEVSSEIKLLSDKVETLEEFKANYDGAKSEARKNAQKIGGTTGAIAAGFVTVLLQIINYFLHTSK